MPGPLMSPMRLRRSRFAFPIAALAALAMLLISEVSHERATSTLDALGSQGAARTAIQSLLRGLIDAESSQRGYLLTNRQDYLQPYAAAQGRVGESLAMLAGAFKTDPASAVLVSELQEVSRNKISELDETIKLHDQGKDPAWRELVLTGIGREQTELVRTLSERLLASETAKVAAGRNSVYRTLLVNRFGVAAMTALSLLALFLYLRQSSALVRQREDQGRLLQAERDQLEVEVRRRTEQLTELAKHLQTVREDERNRLARELHDELGALLTAAKLDVARLKSRLGVLTPELTERLTHLNDGLNRVIALKRRIIEDLRPSSLPNLGLAAALKILLREWSEHTEVIVDATLEPVQMHPSAELTTYRLVQEALTNISKYARATRVQVALSQANGKVRICVRDNGIGFDPDAPKRSTHGLLGMRYRIESEGGRLTVRSAPGAGTEIDAELVECAQAEA